MKKIYFSFALMAGFSVLAQPVSQNAVSNPQLAGTPKTYNLCSYEQEGNALQEGYQSNTSASYILSDDFVVPDGECWDVTEVMASFFTSNLADVSAYEVTFYSDNAGAPGSIIAGDTVPVANATATYVGSNYGYDVHHHLITIGNDIELCGGPGGTVYWISVQVVNISSSFYWECTFLGVYGGNSFSASSEAGPWGSLGFDLVFEIFHNDVINLTEVECDGGSFTVGTSTYSATGVYQDILTNMAGCDSTVNLDLTILPALSSTDLITACDSYLWIDGNTYSTSNNTATHILTSVDGCDSTVTLDLTINTVDNSVTQTGVLLEADEVGASYQWLDCNNSFAAVSSGGTSQSYTSAVNGSFAVEVTANGCVDTSACFTIDYSGIAESDLDALVLYPNPTNNTVQILGLNNLSGIYQTTITSTTGAIVAVYSTPVAMLDLSAVASGVYFVNVYHQDGIVTLRVIRE